MATVLDRFYGTGRRKDVRGSRVGPARVRGITINRRTFEDYFPRETLRMIIRPALRSHEHAGPV
jgi:small subunit ribosomal protein S9